MNPLSMTAAQATAAIRAGRLSAVAYAEAVLAAIEDSQPRLNSFVTVTSDLALATAREIDAAVAAGRPLGPLAGVPVSIKDLVDVDGVKTTHGSAIFETNVATRDNSAVARLRAAGAVIVGKTTTPEFGHKALTDGAIFGTTRNPWNPDLTSGGSSGGAAASVAAGLTPLAVGTDGAGSIRGPAATCGIVGLKPTRGAVAAEDSPDAFANQAFSGPMTRTVGDCAVMFEVMLGSHPGDPWTLGGAVPGPVSAQLAGTRLDGLKLGYIAKMANPELDPEVEANTRATLVALMDLGAEVEEIAEPFDWAEEAGRTLYMGGIHAANRDRLAEWRGRMTPSLVQFAEMGAACDLVDFRMAELARTSLFRRVQGLFERCDLLVSPTTAREPLPADFDATADVVINNRACGLTRQSINAYQYPFNLTGHPAISVPSGVTAAGLPTALQIIGPWWRDRDVIRLAAFVELARPWAARTPAVFYGG